jgi:hypothetical protein
MHAIRKLRESGHATAADYETILAANVVFHSPVLIRTVEGRTAVAKIFAASTTLREGAYTGEWKLDGTLLHSELYDHPIFDAKAFSAQRKLWLLQGERNTWFCGAYFGAGFHEDGLQAGLAVAEQLGNMRRPWQVPNESGRIVLAGQATEAAAGEVLI